MTPAPALKKYRSLQTFVRVMGAAACVGLAVPAARAGNMIENVAECAKATVDASFNVELVTKVLKYAADPRHVACVPLALSGDPISIGGMGATYAVTQAFSSLRASESSCMTQVYTGPPGAALITGLKKVPGVGSLLASTAADAGASAVRSAIGTAVPQLPFAIDCGCGLGNSGLNVDTVKKIYKDMYAVGEQCSEVITEALSDINNAAEKLLTSQTQHMAPEAYFEQRWAPGGSGPNTNLDEIAKKNVEGGGDNWTPWAKPTWEACWRYFDAHTMSKNNSKALCDDMRDGTSRRDGRFAGKGAVQYLRWRQQEYYLPAVLKEAAAAAVKKYDTTANRNFPVPAGLGPYWPKNAQFDPTGALAKIYGSDAKMDAWPNGSVGALAREQGRSVGPHASNSKTGAEAMVAAAVAKIDVKHALGLVYDAQLAAITKVAQEVKTLNDGLKADAQKRTAALQQACNPDPFAGADCRSGVAEREKACQAAYMAFISANPAINDFDNPGVVRPLYAQLDLQQKQCYDQILQWAQTHSSRMAVAPGGAGVGSLVGQRSGPAVAVLAPPAVGAVAVPPAPSAPSAPPRIGMLLLPILGGMRPTLPPVVGAPSAIPQAVAPPVPAAPPTATRPPPQVVAVAPSGANLPPSVLAPAAPPTASPPVAAGVVAANRPPAVALVSPEGVRSPATAAPAIAAPAVPAPPVVQKQPAGAVAAGVVAKPPTAATLPPPVVAAAAPPPVPALDAGTYRTGRARELASQWMGRCAGHPGCTQSVERLIQSRIDEEIALIGRDTSGPTAAAIARAQQQASTSPASLQAAYDLAKPAPTAVAVQKEPVTGGQAKPPTVIPTPVVIPPPTPVAVEKEPVTGGQAKPPSTNKLPTGPQINPALKK